MKISYFEWLVGLVDGGDHLRLMKDLYSLPFVPRIPFDENRAAYGVELRKVFASCEGGRISAKELEKPCSILELLVSLADRFKFELDDPYDPTQAEDAGSVKYFWILLKNLGLYEIDDLYGGYDDRGGRATVEAAVRRLNDRTYAYDGTGGLFPLRHPAQDQRSVEIWYQMNAYLIENYGYQLDAEEAEIAGET